MPKVNREHLFEYRTSIPPIKKQEQLAANLDEVHKDTQRLEGIYRRKHLALEALKRSLLDRAFSGQI